MRNHTLYGGPALNLRSPWDGASRSPLRVLLAALMSFDAALSAWSVLALRPSPISHPGAPHWLLALGGNAPAVAALAVSGVASAVMFARRAGRVGWAVLALASVGVLVEAQAALLEGPMRFLFFSGSALAGWTLGLLFARWLGVDADAGEAFARRAEAFAEQGAVSALAACYLGAVTSKLAASGFGWIIGGGLRATIAGQHAWGNSALLDALTVAALEHPRACEAMSAFTVLAQTSAVLLPFSRRGRMVSASLLLAFHVGVWLLTPISFPQAMLLLALFCYPWPAWWAKRSPRAARRADDDGGGGGGGEHIRPEESQIESTLGRAAGGVALVLALAVTIAWLPPVRAYTAVQHHRGRPMNSPRDTSRPSTFSPTTASRPEPRPLSAATRSLLGDIAPGTVIAGFRVESTEQPEPNLVEIRLTRGADWIGAQVLPHGRGPAAAPVSTDLFDLFYRRPPPDHTSAPPGDQLAVLQELATRLRAREHSPEVAPLLQ